MAMTFPWVEGQLGTNASTTRAAPDRAAFTVDVTDQVTAALDRGDTKVGFVLSGSDEARPSVPPPSRFDCRTVYQVGQLVLTHY
jgi:phage baseplate assembly protein gpV